jgi:hypothetical protein
MPSEKLILKNVFPAFAMTQNLTSILMWQDIGGTPMPGKGQIFSTGIGETIPRAYLLQVAAVCPMSKNSPNLGPMLHMISKIFSPNFSAKKLAFLTQNKAKLCKILILTLVFEKNANFLPKIVKNRRKL